MTRLCSCTLVNVKRQLRRCLAQEPAGASSTRRDLFARGRAGPGAVTVIIAALLGDFLTARAASACTRGDECAAGLVCHRGTCAAPMCQADDQCQPGETCADDGVCEALTTTTPLQLSLVWPARVIPFERTTVTGLSFNLIQGTNVDVYGLEVGGIYNRTRRTQLGIQMAGVVNWVDEGCYGVQIAGIINGCGQQGGIQLSGFVNTSKGSAWGLHASGFVNHTQGDFSGVQTAVVNLNQTSLGALLMVMSALGTHKKGDAETHTYDINWDGVTTGIQVAGLVNSAATARALQVGGLFNNASRRMSGVQLAGLGNGGGMMTGAQVGAFNVNENTTGLMVGVLNIGGDTRGVQIGLVNVARRLQGVQLGLINIAYENSLPFMVGVNAGFAANDREPAEPSRPPQSRSVDVRWQ